MEREQLNERASEWKRKSQLESVRWTNERKINYILHTIAILRQLLFDVLWKSYARAMNSNKLSKWFNISMNERAGDTSEMHKKEKERDKKQYRQSETN